MGLSAGGTETGGGSANSTAGDSSVGGGGASGTAGLTGGPPLFDVATPDAGAPSQGFPQTCAEAAAAQSTIGCEFYPVFAHDAGSLPGNFPGNELNDVLGVAVSNVSPDVANVTLQESNGMVQQVMLDPGALHTFLVYQDSSTYASPLAHDTCHVEGKAMVLTSDRPLQAWQFLPIGVGEDNDASILMPRHTWGTRHRVVTPIGKLGGNYVLVVAAEDDTEVTITLAPGVLGGTKPHADYIPGCKPVPALVGAGDSMTLTLHAGDILKVVTDRMTGQLSDLSGSLVEATRPISVFSGTNAVYLPAADCCSDLVGTAVPPVTTWGKAYPAVKLRPVTKGYDVWKFIADEDETTITLTGDENDVLVLNAGEVAEVYSTGTFWAASDKAFGVARLQTAGWFADPGLAGKNAYDTYDCGAIDAPGDPAMSWEFPPDNWLNRYLLPTASGLGSLTEWCNDTATIVAPTERWQEVTLDGAPLPPGIPVAGSGFSWAYVDLPAPLHEVDAPVDVPVGVMVYGLIHNGSYLYPGGVGLDVINPPEG